MSYLFNVNQFRILITRRCNINGKNSRYRPTKRKKSWNRSNLYIWYRITYITKILEVTGVNPDTRVKDLTEEEVNSIRNYIKDLTVEGDLRREVALNIKRLVEIGSYRGIRHRKGLPLRGQKTKTNARTRKGPKKTIANKKK